MDVGHFFTDGAMPKCVSSCSTRSLCEDSHFSFPLAIYYLLVYVYMYLGIHVRGTMVVKIQEKILISQIVVCVCV